MSGITDVNSITLSIEHMNDYSNSAFTVNVTVTVVDIAGQRNTTSYISCCDKHFVREDQKKFLCYN